MLVRSRTNPHLPPDPAFEAGSMSGESDFAVRELLRKYGIDALALLCAVTLTWFTLKLG